ncbi:ABC transporter permease [Thalassotalea agariperforans]
MPMWMQHSFRLLQHELKRGELTIIALAIILSVSSVFSLTGFSSQIRASLIQNSTKFIAADAILKASRPIDEAFLTQASKQNVQYVQQVEMASMVFADDEMLLIQLKASSVGYPLRGELLVRKTKQGQPERVSTPEPGHIWLDKKALPQLALEIGDEVELGNLTVTVAGIIEQLPDASFSVFTSAPVVILALEDLAATELVQPGSRVGYRYLFASDEDQLKSFETWLKPQLNETQHWQDIKSGNSPLAKALNRAEQYLSLGSMLGIILAAVAVAVASRRYGQRHQASVAIFKAMGASKSHINKMVCLHWSLLCLFSISIGLILGLGLLKLGLWAINDIFEITTTDHYGYPLLVAITTGIICATAFALQPLKSLTSTSPMMILRGSDIFKNSSIWSNIIAVTAVFALLTLFSKNAMLSAALLAGSLIVAGILLLLAHGLMKLGRQVGSQAGKSWHLALANVKRRASENGIQLISFTVAINLLLIILVMKNSIIDEWQAQLPSDAANRFLINVSESQRPAIEEFFAEHDIVSSGLFSVVRGRLAAINDEQVKRKVSKEEETEADNGRRGVGRELNLTWRASLPNGNKVVAGKWWDERPANKLAEQDNENHLVSIEQSLAERLNIVLGDKLLFTLGNEEISVTVSSIREVNWQTMQPNFFMIFHPAVLADFPATYISAIHIKDEKKQALQQFLSLYPTISMLDVEAMINQLREVIAQVSVAIQFILVLVVLAGCLVLIAQVQASMEERERELAILRTLGAKGRILTMSIFYEFLVLGALAGFMASLAMELAVYLLQSQVFNMTFNFHFSYWLLGVSSGALFVSTIGLLACRRLLNLSSVTLIRRTM